MTLLEDELEDETLHKPLSVDDAAEAGAELSETEAGRTLDAVYAALKEKGYNPISQLVGYLLSGDPSYITNHKEARSMIRRVERDEILEVLVRSYLKDR